MLIGVALNEGSIRSLDGTCAFQGVRGQAIYVDPSRQLVMVHLAARASARDPGGADTNALWRAVKQQFIPTSP